MALLAPPAQAGDDEIIVALAICGVSALTTAGVAGGLAHWENGAANDVKKATNNYRSAPARRRRATSASRGASGKWRTRSTAKTTNTCGSSG